MRGAAALLHNAAAPCCCIIVPFADCVPPGSRIRESDADTAAMVENLRDGKFLALVLDKSILEFLAGESPPC